MNPPPEFLNYSPEDVLTMGREMNLEPEALASGLLKHRASVEGYGRETAGDPEKFWKGAVQLDNDTDAVLEKVRQQAQQQALTRALPDQADHQELAYQLEAGGYDTTLVDEKYQSALQEMQKVRESTAYQMPQRIYGGAVKVGETTLARYALREGSDGQMDVSLELPDETQTLLRVPKATDEDVKQALVKKREAVETAFDEEVRVRRGLAFDPLGSFLGRDVAAKQRLEAARQDYYNLGRGREKYLMGEYVRNELKKPEWADKVGQYAGGTEFVKGLADSTISAGALVARMSGNDDRIRELAKAQDDLETLMPGSTRRKLEGGLWNDSVSGAQRAVGNMAPSLVAGGATRLVTSKLAAAGSAGAVAELARQQTGRLGVAGVAMSGGATGSAYIDTQRKIDAAEANGDQELADRLRMGRDMHAILTGVAEGAVERLGAAQAFNVGKGTIMRTARELGMEAIEEPITGLAQRGLVNPVTLGQREDVAGPLLQEALTGLLAAGPLVGGSMAMNQLTGQPVEGPQQPGQTQRPNVPAGGASVSPLGDIAAGTYVAPQQTMGMTQRAPILGNVPDAPMQTPVDAAVPTPRAPILGNVPDRVQVAGQPMSQDGQPMSQTPPQVGDMVSYEGYAGRLQQDGQRLVVEVPNGPVVEVADPAGVQRAAYDTANQVRVAELQTMPDPQVSEAQFAPAGDGTLSLRDSSGNTYVPHNDQLLRSVRTNEAGVVEVLLRNPKRPGQVIKLTGKQAEQAQDAILAAAINVEEQGGTVRYGTGRGLQNLQGNNRSNAGSTTLPGVAVDAMVNMAQAAVRAGKQLAAWAREMVERFGESVRQYLQGAWQAAMKRSEVGAINPQGRGKLSGLLERTKAQTKAGRTVGTSNPTSVQRTGEGTDPAHNVELSRLRVNNPAAYRKNALLLTRYPIVAREQPQLAKQVREIDQPLAKIQATVDAANAELERAKYAVQKAVGEVLKKKTAKVKAAEVNDFLTANPGKRLSSAVRKQQGIVAALAPKLEQAKNQQAAALKNLLSNADAVSLEKADAIYESYITAVESNLETLIKLFPKKLRDIARLWYDGANIIAQNFGRKYGATLEQASAVLAVFSPQKDWFMNVSLAERMMAIWKNDQETAWSRAMSEQYIMRSGEPQAMEDKNTGEIIYDQSLVDEWNPEGIKYQKGARPGPPDANGDTTWINWDNTKAEAAVMAARKLLTTLEGKSLRNIVESRHKARFIRMLSEVRDSPHYAKVSPDGTPGGLMTNDKGVKIKIAWGGYNTIEKAISIMQATTENEHATISEALGEQHKVRSFYNNIADPANTSGHVTMDTHAVAALLWLPLSGASLEVTQNFGSAGVQNDGGAGIKGMYAANAEAYRRAGEAFGLLPREVQSITWEAVRLLFPAKWKSSKANVAKVRAVWERYLNHELSIEQARAAVFEIAAEGRNLARAISDGSGVGNPSWAAEMGDSASDPRGSGNANDSGELSATRGLGGQGSGRSSGGTGSERGGRDRATVVSPASTGRLSGFKKLNTSGKTAGFANGEILSEAADLIRSGITDFANWSRAMLTRFGRGIQDYLSGIWQQVVGSLPNTAAQNVRLGGAQGTAPVGLSASGAVINPFDKLKGGTNIFHAKGEPFRVNSLVLRQILTGSPLPGELVPVLAKTQNEKRSIEQRGAQLGADLLASINATVDRTGLPADQVNQMVSDMLNGMPGVPAVVNALSPALHERTRAVRVLLDNLSAAVAQTLPNTPLRATIVGNLGAWLRRSYAAFDPASGWNYDNMLKKAAAGEKINGQDAADILNKARRYLRTQPGGPHPASEIEADLRDLMDRNVWEGALLGGAGARKSVSSLMQRKDIAPEIRAVMGEENNPVKRAMSSLSFQSQFIARHHGQVAMRHVGLASELFSTQRGDVYTQEIPADGPKWSGLGGTWTTPQLWQALQNAQGVTLGGTDLGGLLVETLKAMGNEAKLNRVALNPDSWLVNIMGNFTSMVQNGDVFSGEILRRIKKARSTVAAGKAKSGAVVNAAAEALLDAQRDMMARLTAAGVLGSSLTLADIEASLPRHLLQWLATDQTNDRIGGAVKGMVMGQSLGRGLGLPGRAVGAVAGAAVGFAKGGLKIQSWQQKVANIMMTGPDALARTTGWLTNYEAGLTAGMAPDAAADWATKRTLNTYPNYAALPGLMREGSRLGLLGSFIAFQHEVYRNFGWNVRYAAEELRSGNPALVQRGAQRLAGIGAIGALAGGGLAALLALTGAAGGDDERNKLFRKWYGAPWEKDAVLSFKDFNDKGVTYFNTSYLLPQMTMVELLQAAREGKTPEEGAARVMDRLYEQFVGGSVHLGPLVAAASNTNRAGRPLTYQKGVAGALERADYALETIMEPGFAAKVEKIVYAMRGAEKNGKSYSVEQEFRRVIGLREQTRTWPELALGAYRNMAQENANIRAQANKEISLNRPGASARAVTAANQQLAELRAKVAEFETDSVKLGVPMPALMSAKREANLSLIRDVGLQIDGARVRSLGR